MLAAQAGAIDLIEIGNLTPRGWVALLVSPGPMGPGGAFVQFTQPGIGGTRLFGSPATIRILSVIQSSDTGFAQLPIAWQGVLPSGIHVAIQPLDIASLRAGLPALLVFP